MATGDQFYYCEKCQHRYNLAGCPIHGQGEAKTYVVSDELSTLRSNLTRVREERDRLRERMKHTSDYVNSVLNTGFNKQDALYGVLQIVEQALESEE
jgi:hypothetical protein